MITWISAVAAVVCLVYYVIIVLYAGFSTSFSWIWLAGAALLAMTGWGSHEYRLHPRKFPLWVPVAGSTILGASLAVFVVVEILVFMGAASSDEQNLDYVIVLGAKVKEEGISKSLKARLDKAIEYSQDNPGTVLILSGGQGSDEPVSEAKAMFEYLSYNGVPKDKMVLETFSTSTVENIAYSKVLIDKLEEEKVKEREHCGPVIHSEAPAGFVEVEKRPVQVGILTSNFHIFRARMIAEKWGIPKVYGIPSKSDPILFPHLCVRECLAIMKDRLMGNM